MRLLFWFRKPNGCATPAPATVGTISARLTVDGKRADRATSHYVRYADWNADLNRVRGNSEAAQLINADLTAIRNRVNALYQTLERAGEYVTAAKLMRAVTNEDAPKPETLCEAWAAFVKRQYERADVGEIRKGTADVAAWRWPVISRFLASTKAEGLLVLDIRAAWGRALFAWMRYDQKHEHSYCRDTVSLCAQVVGAALERADSTQANPLFRLTLPTAPEKEGVYLEQEELDRLTAYYFASGALRRARDVFAFQCLTGLAWREVYDFRASKHIETDERGRQWLNIGRSKTEHTTGQLAVPPLLPEARAILDRYGERLPVPANQVLSRFLKEIAAVLGIEKRVTTHVGRHTFLELMIARGVSFETAAAMAGHSDEKMTKKYAKIRRGRVAAELERVGVFEVEPARSEVAERVARLLSGAEKVVPVEPWLEA